MKLIKSIFEIMECISGIALSILGVYLLIAGAYNHIDILEIKGILYIIFGGMILKGE